MFLLSDASVFVLGDSVSGNNSNVSLPILYLSQSFVTIAPVHHPLEEAGGNPSGGYVYGLSVHLPLAYRDGGGTQNLNIGRKELCALGDVRHHDSHKSCCLCP